MRRQDGGGPSQSAFPMRSRGFIRRSHGEGWTRDPTYGLVPFIRQVHDLKFVKRYVAACTNRLAKHGFR